MDYGRGHLRCEEITPTKAKNARPDPKNLVRLETSPLHRIRKGRRPELLSLLYGHLEYLLRESGHESILVTPFWAKLYNDIPALQKKSLDWYIAQCESEQVSFPTFSDIMSEKESYIGNERI